MSRAQSRTNTTTGAWGEREGLHTRWGTSFKGPEAEMPPPQSSGVLRRLACSTSVQKNGHCTRLTDMATDTATEWKPWVEAPTDSRLERQTDPDGLMFMHSFPDVLVDPEVELYKDTKIFRTGRPMIGVVRGCARTCWTRRGGGLHGWSDKRVDGILHFPFGDGVDARSPSCRADRLLILDVLIVGTGDVDAGATLTNLLAKFTSKNYKVAMLYVLAEYFRMYLADGFSVAPEESNYLAAEIFDTSGEVWKLCDYGDASSIEIKDLYEVLTRAGYNYASER
eukprot:scaffold1481_cov112-Isochrysis_galbana.AAC.2